MPSEVSPMPSSEAEQIIPADSTPRSFGFADLVAAGQRRARQRDRNRLPRRDIGGTADDRPLAVAGVDRADAQAVGVGVRLGAQHPADDEAVGRGRADRADPLDLGPGHRQPLGQLRRLDAGIAVLAQP